MGRNSTTVQTATTTNRNAELLGFGEQVGGVFGVGFPNRLVGKLFEAVEPQRQLLGVRCPEVPQDVLALHPGQGLWARVEVHPAVNPKSPIPNPLPV